MCGGQWAVVRKGFCGKKRSVEVERSCLLGVMGEIQVLTSVGAQKRLKKKKKKKEPLCARDATVTAHCEAGLFVAILMYL